MEELKANEELERMEALDQEYDYMKAQSVETEGAYMAAKKVVDEYTERMKIAKEALLQYHSQGFTFDLLEVAEHKRKGNVDMKELQRKYDLMDSDIDLLRKPEIVVRNIKVKK